MEREENESFIKVREIRGQKQNGAQEDKYQQRTTSYKKLNKNIEQQHRHLQKLGELRCFRKVSSSCFLHNACHVVHRQRHVQKMYIEYSGFHTNGFSQEDTHICFTHYNFAQYIQDIIYWTQPIKTSSFCGQKKISLPSFS